MADNRKWAADVVSGEMERLERNKDEIRCSSIVQTSRQTRLLVGFLQRGRIRVPFFFLSSFLSFKYNNRYLFLSLLKIYFVLIYSHDTWIYIDEIVLKIFVDEFMYIFVELVFFFF